jgi:chemotaxis protein CheZ
MPAPRRIFRIEENAAAMPDRDGTAAPSSPHLGEIMEALGALRAMMGVVSPSQAQTSSQPVRPVPTSAAAAARLAKELNQIAGGRKQLPIAHLSRISDELQAVITGTEQASQKILASAEEIDQLANNLSAALKGKIEQGLAQDISELIIGIFEACNFQDLIGQRVTKVMTTLDAIEEHVSEVLDEISAAAAPPGDTQYLHGPRLDSDPGHISQAEIDAMFAD